MSKPTFFCEHCGSLVNDTEDRCPKCGKRFGGVKCPACGHTGTTQDFANGCPRCHFKIPATEGKVEHRTVESRLENSDARQDPNAQNRRWLTVAGVFFAATIAIVLYYLLRRTIGLSMG